MLSRMVVDAASLESAFALTILNTRFQPTLEVTRLSQQRDAKRFLELILVRSACSFAPIVVLVRHFATDTSISSLNRSDFHVIDQFALRLHPCSDVIVSPCFIKQVFGRCFDFLLN